MHGAEQAQGPIRIAQGNSYLEQIIEGEYLVVCFWIGGVVVHEPADNRLRDPAVGVRDRRIVDESRDILDDRFRGAIPYIDEAPCK